VVIVRSWSAGLTVALSRHAFKHLFERVVVLSAGWGTTSYRRSIEHPFEVIERQLPSPEVVMSPQSTLSPVRRMPTRVLDLTDFRPPVRRLPVVPKTQLRETDLLPPLVISPAPSFERVAPLRLVDVDAPPLVSALPAPKTLTAEQIQLAPGHIRLTRRGRLALLVAAVLCMLIGFSLGDTLSFRTGSIGTPPAAHSIVVQPGQTLWAIATRVAPHADPRATVQQIIDLNHLPSTGLQAGETLSVPS
jgi:LysM domain-containing protein